jgi:hypothetical protein
MLKSEANNFHYIFLGGILGEILELSIVGNYLKENEKILKEMGMDHVNYYTLNSINSAHKNSKKLLDILSTHFLKTNKKFIIFAHSKACLEVLVALKRNFNFFNNCVERIICVQPPFQGSETLEIPVLNPLLKAWPGLNSLRKNFYSELFQEELVNNPERHAYMKERLLVIKAYKRNSRDVTWILRPVHFVMKRTGNKSDGLLKLSEQEIEGAQYSEVVMEMDHSDLFTSTKLSKKNNEFRKTMMISLINSSLLSAEDVVPAGLNDTEISFVL